MPPVDDHNRHPQRDDRDEGEVGGRRLKILFEVAKRVWSRTTEKWQARPTANQDPEGLPRGQARREAENLAPLDAVVELNFHQ